jgi:hypothetical protein
MTEYDLTVTCECKKCGAILIGHKDFRNHSDYHDAEELK